MESVASSVIGNWAVSSAIVREVSAYIFAGVALASAANSSALLVLISAHDLVVLC